jgi:IS4 transposase
MIHRRWDIENNGFRELKDKWHIDHCFMHDPQAIEAILFFMVIAFNLFQLYIFRRVKGFRDLPMTQEFFVEELRFQAVLIETPLQFLLK